MYTFVSPKLIQCYIHGNIPPKKNMFCSRRGQIEKHPILSILVLQDAVLREPSAQSTEASAAIAKAALIMGIQRVPCQCHTTPQEITYIPY